MQLDQNSSESASRFWHPPYWVLQWYLYLSIYWEKWQFSRPCLIQADKSTPKVNSLHNNCLNIIKKTLWHIDRRIIPDDVDFTMCVKKHKDVTGRGVSSAEPRTDQTKSLGRPHKLHDVVWPRFLYRLLQLNTNIGCHTSKLTLRTTQRSKQLKQNTTYSYTA